MAPVVAALILTGAAQAKPPFQVAYARAYNQHATAAGWDDRIYAIACQKPQHGVYLCLVVLHVPAGLECAQLELRPPQTLISEHQAECTPAALKAARSKPAAHPSPEGAPSA